jgi:carboxyl-terminal processing protease
MRSEPDRRLPVVLLAGLLSAWLPATIARAEDTTPRLASARAQELWRKGSDQILAGDFLAAVTTLEQVQRIEPGNPEVASALGWMRDARELNASRDRLRRQMYDYYVRRALKFARQAREHSAEPAAPRRTGDQRPSRQDSPSGGEDPPDSQPAASDDPGTSWSRALDAAQWAMVHSDDEEAFRGEPWLREIVQHVQGEIERHKKGGEWRDAAVLYELLQRIFPKNKAYEEGYNFCFRRTHLSLAYGPKSDWKADLRDVSPTVLPQILERIHDDYVKEVDFARLAAGGLENLILLAEADALSSTFRELGDKDRVANFVNRVRGLLRRDVQGQAELSPRGVRSVFRKVLKANEESLRLPEAVITEEFVSGMLEKLDDFTSVIWPSEVDDFNKHTRGDFVGVGIQITQDFGKHVRVETPLEDSPAYRAGVKPGDLITAVDGKSTLDMTINQAVSAITGEPGSRVVLTIKDTVTDTSRDVPLLREHIKLRTVRGHQRDGSRPTGWDYTLDPERKICYVRVSGFMDKTVDDLEAALDQMRREGCRGLILDLRFNPGGLLTSAVRMCELFLPEGREIVRTKGRARQQNMDITSKATDTFNDVPLVVLINEYSASASEIVAGALAGLKEACVIGTRSFGKGSVQNLIPISDNQAYLKLTTAHYYVYDKDGGEDPWYCLHREKDAEAWGIDPHIVVKVIPMEMNKVLRLRRERDLLKGKDQDRIPREVLERRPTTSQPDEDLPKDEDPDVDPQIAAALNIMRIKLLSNQPWALAPRLERALSRADAHAHREAAQRQ